MTTILARQNYALKKVIYGLSFIILLSATTLSPVYATSSAYRSYHEIEENLPSGVKGYMQSLPRINILKSIDTSSAAKEIASFMRKMRGPEYNDDENKKGITGEDALALRFEKIMESDVPILLVPFGYPSKSTNTKKKVLSPAIDMGEFLWRFNA